MMLKEHKARIQTAIDAIKNAPPHKLRMGAWFSRPLPNSTSLQDISQGQFNPHECKTAACIAGWIAATNNVPLEDVACGTFIGLNNPITDDLFYAHGIGMRQVDELPPEERKALTIKVLENLIQDGTVDWLAALDQVREEASK